MAEVLQLAGRWHVPSEGAETYSMLYHTYCISIRTFWVLEASIFYIKHITPIHQVSESLGLV